MTLVRLEQLHHVLQVAKYGSISKTSKYIFVAQPTISTSIAALEDELGVQLFRRSKQGVQLTDIGELMLAKIEAIFAEVEGIKQISSAQTGHLTGRLDIALMKGLYASAMVTILKEFKNLFPNTSVFLQEKRLHNVITDVFNGLVNFGIISFESADLNYFLKDIQSKNLLYLPLCKDHISVFCSKNHPQAHQKVAFDQILNYPLVNYSNMNVFPSICTLEKTYQFESPEMIKKMVATSENMVTFLPQSSLDNDFYLTAGALVPIHLLDFYVSLDVGLVMAKGNTNSTLEKQFITLLTNLLSPP